MNKYITLLCTIATALLVVGCKSEQEKALDAAKATNDLNALREFKESYSDQLDEKLLKEYSEAYDLLIKDSTLYAAVTSAGGALGRFEAGNAYVKALPQGIHVEEIKIIIEENKAKAEELREKVAIISKAFKLYKFGDAYNSGRDAFDFSEPDGTGSGTFTFEGHKGRQRYKIYFGLPNGFTASEFFMASWHTYGSGTYYIDDDALIHVTLNQLNEHSFKPDFERKPDTPNWKQQCEEMYRRYCPNERSMTRHFLMTYHDDNGRIFIVSKEKGKSEDDWYDAIMK